MNQSSDYDERIKETNGSRVEELINKLKGNVQCPNDFWENLIVYLEDISRKNEYFKQFRSETYEMDAMLKVFFDIECIDERLRNLVDKLQTSLT